jgi:hypothetical protein
MENKIDVFTNVTRDKLFSAVPVAGASTKPIIALQEALNRVTKNYDAVNPNMVSQDAITKMGEENLSEKLGDRNTFENPRPHVSFATAYFPQFPQKAPELFFNKYWKCANTDDLNLVDIGVKPEEKKPETGKFGPSCWPGALGRFHKEQGKTLLLEVRELVVQVGERKHRVRI